MSDAVTMKLASVLRSTANLFATDFEKNFDADIYTLPFARDNWAVAIGCVIGYLVFIFAGSHVMKKYERFDLRMPLALWNAFLCVFSFIGMWRTVRKSSCEICILIDPLHLSLDASVTSQNYDHALRTKRMRESSH